MESETMRAMADALPLVDSFFGSASCLFNTLFRTITLGEAQQLCSTFNLFLGNMH